MHQAAQYVNFDECLHCLVLRVHISGGYGGGVTPVPIPNTAVKPSSADGTWDASPRESRSPPE